MKKIALVACLAFLTALLAVPAFAAGKPPVGPRDTLEFVSCFGPGGGHDTMLRNIEKAARTANLFPNPVQYTYKPGGAQVVGMRYTKSQAGRSDLIMSTTSQVVSIPLQMDIKMDRHDLSNLVILGSTYQFLWVLKSKAEKEGWKTLDDMLTCGKPVSFAISSAGGNEETTVIYLRSKHPQADLRSVAVDGDAEGVVQLLGGHVDVFVNEVAGGGLENYIESGEVIALAGMGPKRSIYAPDVPVIKELGYDFSLESFRGVMGPPDMSPEAIAWWQNVLTKIADVPSFKEYMKQNGVEPLFLIGEDMKNFFDNFEKMQRAAYTLAGIKMVR